MQKIPPVVFTLGVVPPSDFNLPYSCEHQTQFFTRLRCQFLHLNSGDPWLSNTQHGVPGSYLPGHHVHPGHLRRRFLRCLCLPAAAVVPCRTWRRPEGEGSPTAAACYSGDLARGTWARWHQADRLGAIHKPQSHDLVAHLDAAEEQPVQIAAVQKKEPAQKKKFVGKKPGGRLLLVNGTSQMQRCKNWICRKRLIGWQSGKPLMSLYGTEWRERGNGLGRIM